MTPGAGLLSLFILWYPLSSPFSNDYKISEATSSNANKGVSRRLLYDQDIHISSAIQRGLELGSYRCIPTNSDYGLWDLNDRALALGDEHVSLPYRRGSSDRRMWPTFMVTCFNDHIDRSWDQALRNQSTGLDKFISPLNAKLKRFSTAFGTVFDHYVESCNNSQSDEEKRLKLLVKSPVKKKKKGKLSASEVNSTELAVPIDEEAQAKAKGQAHMDSPMKPTTCTYQFGETSMHGYVEALNIPLDEDPDLVPLE
ncbi:hypothetical protein MRB53_026215 [Persea americana]|uniref:Uncharacterized protein n=1 Tax=Persea americana TaxID=3435 RepID=A0ACC2LIM0_PERAE|nr:hypothetical protein MRB53_026215 [Persea americana]